MFCFQIAISLKNSQDLGNSQPKSNMNLIFTDFKKIFLLHAVLYYFR